jgi:transcriptional regulator
MVLTRQEKEQRILDLSQQGYTAREIARDTHTSFRDISTIRLNRRKLEKLKQKERLYQQTRTDFSPKVRLRWK